MRKLVIFSFIWFSLLALFGCVDSNNTSILNEYKNDRKEKLKYEIEQISFSKSFQSINSSIEIIENNTDNLKILAHLDLADYSKIKIGGIIKKANNVDILISGSKDKKDKETSISVPQIIINLDKNKLNDLDNIKFNIVYEDFTPIKIKFNINDVLNKLESHFKISTKSLPRFELINIDDKIVWKIKYNNIFYKDMENTPLINLHALIDANNGNIIESEKNIISSVLDTGHVLDYIQDESILYKKSFDDKESNKIREELYDYNIDSKEKTLLYTSNFKISKGEISPSLESVSIIETSGNGNEVYIKSYDKPKIYKLLFQENFNPYIIKWKENDLLYILGSENSKSVIYTYDLDSNELSLINKINKEVEDFSIFGDYFLLTEKSESEYNKNIFQTKNWVNLKPLNSGFDANFIDDENIIYITRDENTNIDYLSINNLEENNRVRKIDGNVVSYSIFKDNIVYIKNNPNYNDYTIYNYSIEEKEISRISHIICKNAYYNCKDNIIYLNAVLPFENDNTEMIYSIDLDNIKNP